MQHVLPPQFTDLFSLPRLGRNSISGGAAARAESSASTKSSFHPGPRVGASASSSCSCDFFKWRLFIRLPPPARDCVKLHGLICASMIRARREICAPLRFPRRFTISRLPFSSFACCHCLVPCSGCVLLLLALPVDSFMCSARTDLLAKQNSRLIKRKRNPKKRILGPSRRFSRNRKRDVASQKSSIWSRGRRPAAQRAFNGKTQHLPL